MESLFHLFRLLKSNWTIPEIGEVVAELHPPNKENLHTTPHHTHTVFERLKESNIGSTLAMRQWKQERRPREVTSLLQSLVMV